MVSELRIYRKSGAVRLTPDVVRGTIFVSFAKSIGERKERPKKGERMYKWDEKITISLNFQEAAMIGAFSKMALSNLLDETGKKEISIQHEYEKSVKTLTLKKVDGGFVMEMLVGKEKISLNLGYTDLYMLDVFISRYIPDILPKPKAPQQLEKEKRKTEEEEEAEEETPTEEEVF